MSKIHIIGGGLAGLSAAVAAVQAGHSVQVYEAGPAAGGRCRSYFDRELDCRIDNGNHLILSGNHATLAYIDAIGARPTLRPSGGARFPFMDVTTGATWTIAPGPGRIPWWVMQPSRRVPDTKVTDYLSVLALRKAGVQATVAEMLDDRGPLYARLLEPLAVAALNTPPSAALARLLSADGTPLLLLPVPPLQAGKARLELPVRGLGKGTYLLSVRAEAGGAQSEHVMAFRVTP